MNPDPDPLSKISKPAEKTYQKLSHLWSLDGWFIKFQRKNEPIFYIFSRFGSKHLTMKTLQKFSYPTHCVKINLKTREADV